MRTFILFISLVLFQTAFCQQYDTVFLEEEDVDADNEIYKIGNVFIYDYEIIIDGEPHKLMHNSRSFARRQFELVPADTDSVGIEKIYLLILPSEEGARSNENQTEIALLQGPAFDSYSTTGAVENDQNVWIHPIRSGFFNSLETAPFPYIKKPIEIGAEWSDQMVIGDGWGDELWGDWEDELLLTYNYKITGKETVKLPIGELECYVIESTAKGDPIFTKLTSWFSEEYGFVKYEYELMNDIRVTMEMIEFMSGREFNDAPALFKTGEYLKKD